MKSTFDKLPINKEKVTINTDKNNYKEIDILKKKSSETQPKKVTPKVTLKKKEYSDSESEYSETESDYSDSEDEK